jgi:exoribonuclease II
MISPHENVEKHVMALRDVFPPEVMDEAYTLLQTASSVPDPDERVRVDLRHLRSYAIDREGAGEIDDALSIELLPDGGGEKVWIHIADVSRWIRPGSKLSIEAEKRMSSVYMPDEKISLFPDRLSTDLLSLGGGAGGPKGESFALSCGAILGESGEVLSFEICPSKIRLTERVSYNQLDGILSAAPPPLFSDREASDPFSAAGPSWLSGGTGSSSAASLRPPQDTIAHDLHRLNRWATRRHEFRMRRGALDEYLRHKTDLSLSVKRDTKNPAKYLVMGYSTWSNSSSVCLVTEFMILMSQTIAQFCVERNIPVWYKVQDTREDLTEADLRLKEGETPFMRSVRIMRQMRPANDSTVPGKHCTSGSDAYVQCTSPIRRYHDLYNHFRLKAALHGTSLLTISCTVYFLVKD